MKDDEVKIAVSEGEHMRKIMLELGTLRYGIGRWMMETVHVERRSDRHLR